ncbi:hypothetical protein MNBD_PLANCTO03-1389 [hydrothermal vent metagenome]|uniref:Uncharacterized protein n=1 Tax=hydrothermal vent metagenome TaxID=652676 RepID=A0A3B1DDZ7_9ZZZZ
MPSSTPEQLKHLASSCSVCHGHFVRADAADANRHDSQSRGTRQNRMAQGTLSSGVGVTPLSARFLFSVIALLCAVLVTTTSAQRLDFNTAPPDPKPGEGLAVLALADLLEAEADHFAEFDARRAFRVLAADLLRAGENAGTPGAEAILAALTLAAKRDQLDTLLLTHDAATQGYISDLIAETERSILPREVDLVLRDALAPLAGDLDPRCGWWTGDARFLADNTATLTALLDSRHLTDEASAVLAQMVALLDISADHPAYRRDAALWAVLLETASAALDTPPDWLDMPARDKLRADFSAGVAMCLDKPAESRAHLGRTANLVGIIRFTYLLRDSLQSRELRDAVNRLTAAAEGDPTRDPEAVARIAEIYALALALIDAEVHAPPPNTLVRQVRPMYAPLVDAHQQAAEAVVRLLPTILSEPDPMINPGVLAAMSSLQQATDDLIIPYNLSVLLSTWTSDPSRPIPAPAREPIATREMGPLAERVRTLGVALGRDKDAAEALTQLRSLAAIAPSVRELPGERELREGIGSPVWRRVTSDQADRLLFLIEQARTSWLRSSAIAQFTDRRADDELRLRTFASVLPLLRDAAALDTMRADWARKIPPAINASPGLELTPASLNALAGDLTRQASQLALFTARGDDDAGTAARATALRETFAAALLYAQLDAEARIRKLPACSIVGELGTGAATNRAWLAEHRHALAAISRAAFEAAAAEGETREIFLIYANRLALPMLDALP